MLTKVVILSQTFAGGCIEEPLYVLLYIANGNVSLNDSWFVLNAGHPGIALT